MIISSHKKKVCHFISSLGTGGAERALYNLLCGPVAEEFDHEVICLTGADTYSPMIEDLGISVKNLDIKSPSLKGLARTAAALRPRADIVQGWMYHGNLAAWAATRLRRTRAPLVWNIRHSLDDLSAESRSTLLAIRACRRLSNAAATTIYNSDMSIAQHRDYGYASDNALLIPNGFDTAAWKPDEAARATIRRELGLSDTSCVIVHVGRYTPAKDHVSFLKASIPLLETHPEAVLVLAGRGVDQQQDALTALIPDPVKNRVHLLGNRPDIPQVLAASDIFVQSSVTEGFPNSLAEAMSCALCIVATSAGDSKQIVGNTGTVVAPRDISGLRQGIETYLNAPDLRRQKGAEARDRIANTYPIDRTDSDYLELYRKLT